MGRKKYILSKDGLIKIEQAITEQEVSQEQVALECCLNRSTVSKVVVGEEPVNLRSIRKLFLGLQIPLGDTDYINVQSTNKVTLSMSQLEDIKTAMEQLEQEADEAERQGDSDRAEQLRESAAKLRAILDENS